MPTGVVSFPNKVECMKLNLSVAILWILVLPMNAPSMYMVNPSTMSSSGVHLVAECLAGEERSAGDVLQPLLNQISSNPMGGSLTLKGEGIWKVSSTLTIGDNTVLRGDPSGPRAKLFGSTQDIIGRKVGATEKQQLIHLEIRNDLGRGVNFNGAVEPLIEDCVITSKGVAVAFLATKGVVRRSILRVESGGTATVVLWLGIDVSSGAVASYNIIEDNDISNYFDGQWVVGKIATCDGVSVYGHHNQIIGNYIHNCNSAGIYVSGVKGQDVTGNLVAHNKISIILDLGIDLARIAASTFTNNEISAVGTVGFGIFGSSGNEFSYNRITDVNRQHHPCSAIHLEPYPKEEKTYSCTGNKIRYNYVNSPASEYGIGMYEGINGNVLANNTVFCGTEGWVYNSGSNDLSNQPTDRTVIYSTMTSSALSTVTSMSTVTSANTVTSISTVTSMSTVTSANTKTVVVTSIHPYTTVTSGATTIIAYTTTTARWVPNMTIPSWLLANIAIPRFRLEESAIGFVMATISVILIAMITIMYKAHRRHPKGMKEH